MKLKELSLATFNLYNLNEPGLPLYADKDGWTQDEYDLKIAWTARQLRILKSDIFGFQELWHAASLHRALDEAGQTDEYDVVAPTDADGSHIVCAAIVRKGLLVGEPDWISAFPDKFKLQSRGDDPQTPLIDVGISGFSRPVCHFTIRPREDEPEVHVYVCHFKSKAPTKVFNEPWFKGDRAAYAMHATALGAALSTIRRTAEAAALRFLLTAQLKGNDTPVIVLGDINDGQHSNTANILTEQPRYLVGDSVGGGDVALYTAQTLQEYRDTRDVYYTHVHQDLRESLDHILVSEQFYDNSRKRRWLFDGMAVNNDHLNFDDHKADGTNDHGVIRAVFKHKPIKLQP
ncbi:endonuclease/exonuclease/phosphatase family protein [Variovorax sp. KK3]|uniref:endonuclease/exonuclease/phosphatase family protein n=1 Tax=Variovorax sp. KK3 TaxID=1855728 RepID=UPI00097C9499|nr:endonuclease/exonuclease/phosphatase family protein [Variovorax sp. KK3]